jgi:hypothetical protein
MATTKLPGPITKRYFQVTGCSWAGKTTRRDGKAVTCGHKHRSRKTAEPCERRMRETRPGNCQDYRAQEIVVVAVSRQQQ